MSNPLKTAMEYVRGCPPGEHRVVAMRTAGDGIFVVKTYKDGIPQGEVEVGGRRDLDEALASLS